MNTTLNLIEKTLSEGRGARLPVYVAPKNHHASVSLIKHYFDFLIRTETLHRKLPPRLARALLGSTLGNTSCEYSWLIIYSVLYPFIQENDQIRIGNYPRPRTTLDVLLSAVGKLVLELTPIIEHYRINNFAVPALEVALQAYAEAAFEGEVHPGFVDDLCTIGKQLDANTPEGRSCQYTHRKISYRFSGDNYPVSYLIPFARNQYTDTLIGRV